ncbi:MAG TPA: hypothetical protein VGB85_09725 [Nannocystis sp.]
MSGEDDRAGEGGEKASPTLAAVQRLALSSGYSVESNESLSEGVLSIKAPDGRVFLKITLGADGPMVELQSASLSVAARGELTLDCQKLAINAAEGVAIRSGGDIVQVAQGDVRVVAGGVIDSEGHAQNLRARRGDVQLTANDDVALDGERVRLNSPKPGVHPREQMHAAAGPALPGPKP